MIVCNKSLPSWECGLKLCIFVDYTVLICVTPFVGVWIEIPQSVNALTNLSVTPFVGVWIEIHKMQYHDKLKNRHSLRGSVD